LMVNKNTCCTRAKYTPLDNFLSLNSSVWEPVEIILDIRGYISAVEIIYHCYTENNKQ
jgi:hypothetical protein